jgi:hypothetical protein
MAATDTLTYIKQRKASPLRAAIEKCFSFPVLLGAVLTVIDFLVERGLQLDPDTWWHIKYGQSILHTGHWPAGDIYSFTARGVVNMAYEWGGDVLMALAYRLGQLRGLDLLLIVLTSIFVLLLYWFAHLRCGNSKAAFLGTLLALPLAAFCLTMRPQLLGFIFLLIVLICLERYRLGRQKSLWLLPPLFLVWVNTHGMFALGLFILAVYWVSGLKDFSLGGLRGERWGPKQRIHLALVFLASVAVLPITPYGSRLAAYPLNFAFFHPVIVGNVREWQPLPSNLWQTKLLFILLLAFIVAPVMLRLTYRLEELGLFVFAAYATLLHGRFVFLFAILLAPLVASIVAPWVPKYDRAADKYVFNAVLIAGAILLMLRYFPSEAKLNKKVAENYPVQAVDYLRHHSIPGPLFNSYSFGGYLLWSMGPEQKVFIDGRDDLYEETGALSDYMRIVDLEPDTLAILTSYGIRSCLIARNPDAQLATLLAATPGWRRAYEDKVSELFVRQSQTGGPFAEHGQ